MSTTNQEGVFINGKAQVVEMLKFMSPQERSRLLKHIRSQNVILADELSASSVGIEHIGDMTDEQIKFVFKYINAPIMGIALKGVGADLQRRILLLADRNYAEETYKYMTMDLQNEDHDITRAQEKVKSCIINIITGI